MSTRNKRIYMRYKYIALFVYIFVVTVIMREMAPGANVFF